MSVGAGFVSRPCHFVAPSLPLVGRFVTIFKGQFTLARPVDVTTRSMCVSERMYFWRRVKRAVGVFTNQKDF